MNDFLSKVNLPDNSLIITFDDGHKNNVELLPIIKIYSLMPVIYLCSQVVATNHPFWWKCLNGNSAEPYKKCTNIGRLQLLKEKKLYYPKMVLSSPHGLTKDDINTLKNYVIFGSHTRIHPILPQCTQEEQWDEIANSKKELEALCDCPIEHFAYPNGDYNNYSIECVKLAGYKTARTTDVGWNDGNTNRYKLRVIGISDDADMLKLRFQLSGLSLWIQYLLKGSFRGRK